MAASVAAKAGSKAAVRARPARAVRVAAVNRPEVVDVSRRALLSTAGAIAGAVLLASPNAALAAYGDNANVFGKITNKSGYVPYAGDGFTVNLPSKYNPSKEKDFPDVILRYEDNFDAVNNVVVIKSKASAGSISGYGSPEDFLKKYSYLLGKQAYAGETVSEGGFAPNRVSAASLLGFETKNKSGKEYYEFDVLTRTADGDEGGRHQLIAATVGKDGNLYIIKAQCGDKRWFKGASKDTKGLIDSFTVA